MNTFRTLTIDASEKTNFKVEYAVGGVPGPTTKFPNFPDMTDQWRLAGVKLVRSYDWISRLDTRNNPDSLFPDWDADPLNPESYNFEATDEWVNSVHAIGAQVLFNFSSSIPQNKLPALDLKKYGQVIEQIVRHYSKGWARGPQKAVVMYEFGDQPDFGKLHFSGSEFEFFAMYGEFCKAVKAVDSSLLVGGPSLAFPLNTNVAYREQFLTYISENRLDLDFYSFLWFVDATRDPMDFQYVSKELRQVLDQAGFSETKLMLSYWNYLAVPSNHAPTPEKAAFQVAAAIYQQGTALDYSFFFRADSGKDPHYDFIDPAGIYSMQGIPDERAEAFRMIGEVFLGQRIEVRGGNDCGFAGVASISDKSIKILISNFVAPSWAQENRDVDEFRFQIPIGPERIELAYALPPKRKEFVEYKIEGVKFCVAKLPWDCEYVEIQIRTASGIFHKMPASRKNALGEVVFELEINPQTVALAEITPIFD